MKALLLAAWPILASGGVDVAPTVPYEDQRTMAVLAAEGLALDPAPAGKRVAWVRIVRHDVFAEDEVIPTFFNVFHGLTDEDVIARELVVRAGDTYDEERIQETRRILRAMGLFALVRVVPIAIADRPGEVGVLVYTRDLWSLRFEQRFQFTGGQFDELTLQLTELNLGGRGKRLTTRFNMVPFEYSLGQVYVDRRVWGSDLLFMETGDLILNRETNALEGGRLFLRLDRPFWDLSDRWGFSSQFLYDQRVGRQVSGDALLTWDDPRTVEIEAIPRAWDQRWIGAVGAVTRQTGGAVVNRFTGGFGVSDFNAEAHVREGFEPRDLRRIYPFVAYSGFVPTYRIWHDLATYGLAEDVRLGPSWSTRLATPLSAFGSNRDTVELRVSLSHVSTWAGDGLLEGAVAAEGEVDRGDTLDELFYLRARAATPGFSFGRLLTRWDWQIRRQVGEARSQALVSLGGDNGLRGYPSQAFYGFGEDLMRGSVEWRTPPLEWHSLHVGGVMFYDAGSIHPRLADAELHQSVGLGGRFLLPQFNRFVYRVDLGVPLDGTGFMVNLTAGSNQATPMTENEDEIYENFIGGLPVQPTGPQQILQ